MSQRLRRLLVILMYVGGTVSAAGAQDTLPVPPLDALPAPIILPDLQFQDETTAVKPLESMELSPVETPFSVESADTVAPPAISAEQAPPPAVIDSTPLGISVTEETDGDSFPAIGLLYRENNTGTEVIPRGGTGGFGLTTLSFSGALAGDGGGNRLWFEPQFEWTFLNGPLQPDLPPQLYELSFAANATVDLGAWNLALHVAPMLATDFDNTSSDMFRIAGGGIALYDLSPAWKLMGGAMYLDRPDLEVLPHAGILWRPDGNVEIDFAIPRPRAALRLDADEAGSSWLYLGGNVGGGSWAYERLDNSDDRLGYFDMRVTVGLDLRGNDGSFGQWEIGYVFGRKVHLAQSDADYDMPDGLVIRLSSSY